MSGLRAFPIALALLSSVSACAGTQSARGSLHYSDEAQAAYERGMDRFRDEEWPEATEAFRAVQREYSASRYATLAELRLADVMFRQETYTEALAAYRAWLRYHPSSDESVHAHFMIAHCYVKQMPDDWFLVPPSYERDLSSVHDAEGALSRFIRDYPEASQLAEARRLLGQVRLLLARHEYYVAEFYVTRERYPAAINRLLGVIGNYEGSGLEPRALLQLGELYLRSNRQPEARGAFQALLESYPRSPQVEAARRYLARVGPGASVPPDTDSAVIPVTRPARPAAAERTRRQ
ncbi:MAG: outer membrane protein assembly factor BamD [Myxococcaceae bacterium]|nr:MAG: outer membrane protein assembly factor BamD [Myxococcaceae bacterium]